MEKMAATMWTMGANPKAIANIDLSNFPFFFFFFFPTLRLGWSD